MIQIWCNTTAEDEAPYYHGEKDRDGDFMGTISTVNFGEVGFSPIKIVIEQGVSTEFAVRSLLKAADMISGMATKS